MVQGFANCTVDAARLVLRCRLGDDHVLLFDLPGTAADENRMAKDAPDFSGSIRVERFVEPDVLPFPPSVPGIVGVAIANGCRVSNRDKVPPSDGIEIVVNRSLWDLVTGRNVAQRLCVSLQLSDGSN